MRRPRLAVAFRFATGRGGTLLTARSGAAGTSGGLARTVGTLPGEGHAELTGYAPPLTGRF